MGSKGVRYSFVPLQHAPRIAKKTWRRFLFPLCLCHAYKHTQAELLSMTNHKLAIRTGTVCLIIGVGAHMEQASVCVFLLCVHVCRIVYVEQSAFSPWQGGGPGAS